MKKMRLHINKWFIGFTGVCILINMCLSLKDTRMPPNGYKEDSEQKGLLCSINPKAYLISHIAPLFANLCNSDSVKTAQNINKLFKETGIKASLIENTIKICNGAYEFSIYIPQYKKDFQFRYTPLVASIPQLIRTNGFKLEIMLFSRWKNIEIEKLFG